MEFLKELAIRLSEDVPVWLRSILIVLIIVFSGMWALGFNYQNIRDIVFLNNVRRNSILLSKRSCREDNETVDASAKKIYKKMCDTHGMIGVSIISFEPEIQPKVLKVISREGDSNFEKTIQVGSERYLSGGAKSLFIANREGIIFLKNIEKNKLLKDIGVKSAIYVW